MNLSSADAARLRAAVGSLLSTDACSDVAEWHLRAGRALRDLADADAACLALEDDASSFVAIELDDAITRSYQEHFAAVDYGIARQRAARMEVWDRGMLWRRAELARSEYYNDFALPNRLRHATGIATFADGRCLRVCLLYTHGARTTRAVAARRRRLHLLRLAWPTFNAGAVLCARTRAWHACMAQIVDRVDHAHALCTGAGRILHQNAALTALLAANPRAELPALIRTTARAAATNAGPERPVVSVPDPTLPGGSWRLLGWPLEAEPGGPSMVLVSLLPTQQQPRNADALRARFEELRLRFGLTLRQMQVVELLRKRCSNTEIALALRISEHTARHHTEMVLSKLGMHSRRQLAMDGDALPDAERR